MNIHYATLAYAKDTLLSLLSVVGHKISALAVVVFMAIDAVTFRGDYREILLILVLVVLDTGTGFAKAIYLRNLQSRFFFRSVPKVVVYGIMLVTAGIVDHFLGFPLDASGIFSFVSMFSFLGFVKCSIVIAEAISINENLQQMDMPISRTFAKYLRVAQDRLNTLPTEQKDGKDENLRNPSNNA